MAISTKYIFVDDNGRVQGTCGGQPLLAEISANNSSVSASYAYGVDDNWSEAVQYNLSRNTIVNKSDKSWDYRAEWYLLCDASNGSSFSVGEVVSQQGGAITGECVGFQVADRNQWTWKKNIQPDDGSVALLTIRNLGPTGGVGGQTMPIGGTGGTHSGGPSGHDGGLTSYPITGVSSSASWNVIGVSRRISVNTLGNQMKQYEIDQLGGACYAHIQYAQGVCLDLHGSPTEIGKLFNQVKLNHDIHGQTSANATKTVTVYDRYRVAHTINAVSGGTPDGACGDSGVQNSQLRTLYHNLLKEGDVHGASLSGIEDAYKGIGGTSLDTAYKLRTYFEGRNA
jgi:hypothetical protein